MENKFEKSFEELEKRINERKLKKEEAEKMDLLDWVEDQKIRELSKEIDEILTKVSGEITDLSEEDYQKLLKLERDRIGFLKLIDEVLDPIKEDN